VGSTDRPDAHLYAVEFSTPRPVDPTRWRACLLTSAGISSRQPKKIQSGPAVKNKRNSATQGSHMKIDVVLAELKIPREAYRVIMLMPLVYVAWADGKIQSQER
jgi:hypothetical protein